MARLSPLHQLPDAGPPLLVTVGARESDEFRRQSLAYLDAWQARGLRGEWLALADRNHFTALDALTEPAHPLFRAVLEQATGA